MSDSPTPGARQSVTRILTAVENGDREASAELLPLVYEELRNHAARLMRQERVAGGQPCLVFDLAVNTPLAAPSPVQTPGRNRGPRVVVIDAGHGGRDPGAIGATGVLEKDVVLDAALQLRQALRARGYHVALTRDTDRFVPLEERVRFARGQSADLFISLHADWVVPKYANKARGLAIYTRSEQASDEEARLLAMRENSADEAAGLTAPDDEEDAVQDMLTDLWQEETRVHSRLFAQKLLKQVKSASRLLVQPHRYAAFYVLRNPEVPSVLIELGFLSNAKDAKEISSDDWQKKVAGSMLQAVEAFFAEAQQPLSAVQ